MSQTKAELIEPQGNVAFDTNTLYVDAGNNRVGIGTTSPGALLDIRGLDNSGALQNLDLWNTSTAAAGQGALARLITRNSANNGTSSFDIVKYQTGESSLRATDSSGFLTFFTGGFSERARIDSSGRLLVGTSSSVGTFSGIGANLQVSEGGGVAASLLRSTNDDAGANLVFRKTRDTAPTGVTVVQNNDILGRVGWMGTDGTNALEAARISAQVDGTPGTNDMPGRLVFSTTADGASSPTERMRVKSNGVVSTFSSDGGIYPSVSTGAGTAFALIYGRHSATNFDSGTNSFVVWSNGNVVNTNNSYGAISDVKLKENIVDASSQWDDIKALQVRKYNFKEGQTHTQIGLIAQEVELVSPGLVSESPDRNAEGNDLGTVTKSVNYSVLYMKAVKALQEAMERIETLEAKVAALESA